MDNRALTTRMHSLPGLVWLLLFFSLATASYSETISLRADYWYPINGTPGSAQPGYMVEIADKVFSDAGHKLDYQTIPWIEALQLARAGVINCVAGAYKEDAPTFIFPEEPMGMDLQAFYVKADQPWRFSGDLHSLDNIKVGVISGYTYDEAFMKYSKQHGLSGNIAAVTAENALDINLRKILNGTIVTTLDSVFVVEAKLKEAGLEGKIIQAGSIGKPHPMYIACTPRKPSSKEYIRLLSEGVRNMRKNGELATLLKKYGLKDWK